MKNNKVTTLDTLAIGDRFYKAGDQKKIVWQLMSSPSKSTYNVKTDKEMHPRTMRGNAPVVFLRSAMETAK